MVVKVYNSNNGNKKRHPVKLSSQTVELLKQIQNDTNKPYSEIIHEALSNTYLNNEENKFFIIIKNYNKFLSEAYCHTTSPRHHMLQLLLPIIHKILLTRDPVELQERINSFIQSLQDIEVHESPVKDNTDF